MKKPQAPGLSDSTLSALWRKVVLHVGNNTCVICCEGGTLQAHHVIHRRYKMLRWDWRNGVPVHAGDCHETANTQGIYAAYSVWRDYLMKRSRWLYKQYVTERGMSETDWRHDVKADLLAELGGAT
jgi:hypothetical protein